VKDPRCLARNNHRQRMHDCRLVEGRFATLSITAAAAAAPSAIARSTAIEAGRAMGAERSTIGAGASVRTRTKGEGIICAAVAPLVSRSAAGFIDTSRRTPKMKVCAEKFRCNV
jgi:hypothetical protein